MLPKYEAYWMLGKMKIVATLRELGYYKMADHANKERDEQILRCYEKFIYIVKKHRKIKHD